MQLNGEFRRSFSAESTYSAGGFKRLGKAKSGLGSIDIEASLEASSDPPCRESTGAGSASGAIRST
jgi:hypothetical protein